MMSVLSRTEEMLLLVVCSLQENAYGADIREEVQRITGKRYSVGGIYVPLDRLVQRGWLKAEDGHPGPERQGRPRRLFMVSASGMAALRESQRVQRRMWERVPELVVQKLQLR